MWCKLFVKVFILSQIFQVASAGCGSYTGDDCSWFGIDGCPDRSSCEGTLGWGQCHCDGSRFWADGSCKSSCGSYKECDNARCDWKDGQCSECDWPEKECDRGSCKWRSSYCYSDGHCDDHEICNRQNGADYGRCIDTESPTPAPTRGPTPSPTTGPTPSPTEGPTAAPTSCPTPDVGGGLIDVTASEVTSNGRVILDFEYSYVVSDFELTMKRDIYSYSGETPNDWTMDNGMCYNSIYREFTYNQLQESLDFTVENGDVYFAVDSSFKYTTTETMVIDGVEHQWDQMVTREKDLPFKLHVPETTTLSIGVTSNQEEHDRDKDFIIHTNLPTTSVPSATPSLSEPTEVPSLDPSYSAPTDQPSFSYPSVSPSISEPTKQPSEIPTISKPTELPSTDPSYSEPTEQPTATDPSASPSNIPTEDPTYTSPSEFPTSTLPSLSPIPDAKVLATVVEAVAEETRQLGTHPLVDITYTTVIKFPWKLESPVAEGNAIIGNIVYNIKTEGACDTFTDLPAFLQQPDYYCQTWHLQFDGDRRCTTEGRTVKVGYSAVQPRGENEPVEFSWEFDLGFSSAFDCSEDLGTFQIAIIVEGSSGADKNWETPGEAYLDDWYHFRIGISSGAPVQAVNIADLQIYNSQNEPLCEDCMAVEALQIGISDYSPDNFVVQLVLDSSIFGGVISTQIDFTFDITMSPERRRRRLQQEREDQITLAEKVTLYLRPHDYPVHYVSSLPTATNPYPPTKKPVEAVREAAGKDLVSVGEGSDVDMNIIYMAVGGVFLLMVAFAAAHYFRNKESVVEFDEDDSMEKALEETNMRKVSLGGAELVEIH